jgi:hypothetical protein
VLKIKGDKLLLDRLGALYVRTMDEQLPEV